MARAYKDLHHMGLVHSVEAWEGEQLAGGLYGLRLGRVFFGESMFTLRPNASKAAFIFLVSRLAADGVTLVDCQVESEHLRSMGAVSIPRARFIRLLSRLIPEDSHNNQGPLGPGNFVGEQWAREKQLKGTAPDSD